jgi:hypothetical protein
LHVGNPHDAGLAPRTDTGAADTGAADTGAADSERPSVTSEFGGLLGAADTGRADTGAADSEMLGSMAADVMTGGVLTSSAADGNSFQLGDNSFPSNATPADASELGKATQKRLDAGRCLVCLWCLVCLVCLWCLVRPIVHV